MAQPFSFGFNDDDIDDDGSEEGNEIVVDRGGVSATEEPPLFEPRLHSLEEMLSQIPSSLTYSTNVLRTISTTINLPRRELFDIRAQLMADDDLTKPQENSLTGLSTDDIKPKIYEGGFKTWECSFDLARYLARLIEERKLTFEGKGVHFIELGAGTSLPTSLLLSHILSYSHSASPPSPTTPTPQIRFTLADYNPLVLTHASLPNLLLTFSSLHADLQPFPPQETLSTPKSLLTAFTTSLAARNIIIDGVSGAWGEEFVNVIRNSKTPPTTTPITPENPTRTLPTLTLILASETIYSPSSLRAFTSTLLSLLSPPSLSPPLPPSSSPSSSLALIAAKRVYFGVGGGVDEFLRVLVEMGGWGRCVWDSTDADVGDADVGDGGGGVGRCILEVGLGLGLGDGIGIGEKRE